MSLTCGFYNSMNDRKYDALQISSMFDGIINDGIYQSIGKAMIVEAKEGMRVVVNTGRAWFNHTWTVNDALYPIDVPASELVLDCIYTVVLEINATNEVRNNTFKLIKGTPASAPTPPDLIENMNVHQHPLANIYLKAGAVSIKPQDITNLVGSDRCPFVTGVLEHLSIDNLTTQWKAEFNDLFATLEKAVEDVVAGTVLDGSVTTPKLAKNAVNEPVKIITIPITGWSKGNGFFYQNLNVPNLPKDQVKYDADLYRADLTTGDALSEASDRYGLILAMEVTAPNTLYVRCSDIPDMPFKIKMGVTKR